MFLNQRNILNNHDNQHLITHQLPSNLNEMDLFKRWQRHNSLISLVHNDVLLNESNGLLTLLNLQIDTIYTDLGQIYATYSVIDKTYTIFLNKIPLTQVNTPIVKYAMALHDRHILLIFEADSLNGQFVYTILDLSHDFNQVLREISGSNELVGVAFNHMKTCSYLKFRKIENTSATESFEIYQYCGNGINKVFALQSDEVYRQQMANATLSTLIQLAKQDNCYNETNHSLDITRSCGYAVKYCHLLNFIPHRENSTDQNIYHDLVKSCDNYITKDLTKALIN
jgi:hypothetical protein